jgi:AhpD family alkylhydroperoxidase
MGSRDDASELEGFASQWVNARAAQAAGKGDDMDERTKELIAIGASVAANCHPCTRFHLAKCDELGIARENVAAAAKVGQTVNRGAAGATREFVADLLGEDAPKAAAASGAGCCV